MKYLPNGVVPPTTAPGVEATVDTAAEAGVAGTVITGTAVHGAVTGTVPGIAAVMLLGTTRPMAVAGTDVTGTIVTGTNPGIAPAWNHHSHSGRSRNHN